MRKSSADVRMPESPFFSQLPNNWGMLPLKHFGRLRGGSGFPDEYQGVHSAEIPFFKVKALERAAKTLDSTHADDTVSPDIAARLGATVFPKASLVFAKVGAALMLGRYRFLGQPSCIDNNMMALVLQRNRIDPRFVWYVLGLLDLSYIVNPGAVPSVNATQVGSQLIPEPPIDQQVAIANFLDRETAEADALVAKYERLIELLEEKRVAIIAQAVTKGMDAKASMKDFRAEWVGQVPKHWKEPALGYVASVELGKMRTAEPKDAESILVPYLKARNIAVDGLRFEPMDRMWCSPLELQDLSVRHEDIIICEGGVTFGRSAIASSSCPPNIIFEKSLHRVRPSHSVDARFLNYAIIALRESGYLHTIAATATFSHLTREKLVAMKFPMPPIDEQRWIVHHIDTQLSQSDKIILKVRAAIDILWERRSTLITAAVTGQIDVSTYRSKKQSVEVEVLV